jgi:esterase/lipase superfamily enzyme
MLLLAIGGAPSARAFDPDTQVISTRGTVGTDTIFAENAYWKAKGNKPPVPPLPGVLNPCPKSMVLYVHGFGNSPADAQGNFAQAESALQAQGYTGPVVGFSWDSDTGVTGFDEARESANLNGVVLADVQRRIKQQCPGIKINCMSHSLGARVILRSLKVGGCCATTNLLAPAVDNEVLEDREEFGGSEITNRTGKILKVWYNHEDNILSSAYVFAESDSALGNAGPEHPECVSTAASWCSATPKMEKSGVDQDNHSGYLGSKELMKCVVKFLR